MSGNDEENGSEDDEEYIPSDPDEDIDDEQHENSGSSAGDDDAINKETEDERQQRLKSLFEDFIGENDAKPKSSTSQALPTSTVDGKHVSKIMSEIPKLAAETADDIFGGVSNESHVLLKNRPEPCQREKKPSGLAHREKKRALDGLSSAISALSKKSKISVLEKTAQDWGAFKTETGIQEELTSHNRGKQGYVDRVEFLSRTDYRQFEIERDARNAARKK
ncbi:unnamed protein product [Acanthocheilonema viteae]|uniref:Craniofacial development protein 1 n=1 Tax=Acanthocheilonema viteae TaxID=6277 RepID=A0A498RXP2_ACAVI|nr:unnamed protein product [Acanthocheilonema viteae]